MKLAASTSALAALATVCQIASANFDLYQIHRHKGGWSADTQGWQIFDNDPPCDQVLGVDVAPPRFYVGQDLVGDTHGIRCKGKGCDSLQSDPADIDEFEMKFTKNQDYHFTIYKHHDHDTTEWHMYGTDNKVYGTCIPFPTHDLKCCYNHGKSCDEGKRFFRCMTSPNADTYTATQINAAAIKDKIGT